MADSVFVNPYSGTPIVFAPHTASIIMAGVDGSRIVAAITGVRITFQRQNTTQYPIGVEDAPIKILGIPSGTLQFDGIIGPNKQIEQFLLAFGKSCTPFDISLKFGNREICDTSAGEMLTVNITGALGKTIVFDIRTQNTGVAQATGTFICQFDNMTIA